MKTSHEEDYRKVTKLWYKQLFKLITKLIEENDKIKKCNLNLKDYIGFLKKSNETLMFEIANIRNSTGTCDTYVSMKK